MTEDDLVRLYQRGTSARRATDRAACAPPEALLAVVEQRGSEEERFRTINHAMSCDACSEELELLRSSRVVRDQARIPHARFALAASLVLVAGLGYYTIARRAVSASDDLTRGNSGDVQLVSPSGTASRADPLVWHAVTSSTAYVVELRRDDGTLVTTGTTTDTTFVVPDSARVAPGTDLYWAVSARLADGSEVRSAARRVRLTSP